MKSNIKSTALLCVICVGLITSCAEFKNSGKTLGHAARDTSRAIGHAARDTTKAIGHGTRDTVKAIGRDTKKALDELSEKDKDK